MMPLYSKELFTEGSVRVFLKEDGTLVIPLAPVPKPRMTRRDRWTNVEKQQGRPAVLRYFAYKDHLNMLLGGSLEPRFDITFYVPMSKSWSKKKKAEFLGKPHQVKPDIDNYLKAFMDALCDDDSYVYDTHNLKFWANDGRIELKERPE